MMTLYALKSDDGYLKIDENDGFTVVSMNKASVYSEEGLAFLKRQKQRFDEAVSGLRVVQMIITETDPYLG
ncbi:MAG: hypothetical protein PWP16_629 [Eubacteriaceae bacterium]|jgi:hypothetical protein|nr:hypothetical protein [Eubacteriaceae bacterium]MDK2904964.1 hypothetical protein [Eubacteriaceae bacterium]MDN5307266.1 hypothetical protein [Eubacteriaceae bacterium]